MVNKITHAKSRVEGEVGKIIGCEQLDKTDYDAKYKGKLGCKNGCVARIKFTQRKNTIKFFSTWNKEGHLHDEGCPYRVEYKGKVGRARLKAYYRSIELDDETILRRLKDKMERLLKNYAKEDIVDPVNGTCDVENTGKKDILVFEGEEGGEKDTGAPNIGYLPAECVGEDEVGCSKGVFGYIDNVQLEEDKYKRKYAYFNLVTKYSVVNIAFPEAFYKHELAGGSENFEMFIENVKKLVEKNPKKIMVIAYGDITKKRRKKGVNVLVISPSRILVDNKTYNQIIYERINKQ